MIKITLQLQLIFCFKLTSFVFFWFLQVSGNWQKPKRNYMAADGCTKKIRVWWTSTIFDFVIDFFSEKIQHEVLILDLQLILSFLWLRHLKMSTKSKKWSKSIKNDTKDGIIWVWNELRPKLQQLVLNKGHFEKVVLT